MIKLVGSTLLALAVVACSNPKNTPVASLPLTSAQTVPGAMGLVTVNADTMAGNTKLDVKVEHLAPPPKIAPTAHVYVVWARTQQREQPQNLGALEVDRDLRGELETLTPLKNFELFITPEASSSVTMPTNAPVLSTHVNAP